MEKRKIIINHDMAVYLKNATNAFIKYADTFNERNQHDGIKKERHYCKVVFFNNIDRILNSIDVRKKDKFDILMRILNFILEHHYIAHEYYDTFVALHPWMGIWDFYRYDKLKRKVNKKAKRTKGEIIQKMNSSLDKYYIGYGYGSRPNIKHLIGMEIY